MPIARVSGKLVLFMHVPRCGGTSMEDYLEARFGPSVRIYGAVTYVLAQVLRISLVL